MKRFGRYVVARTGFDPGHHFFSVFFTVYTDDLYVGDPFVDDQKIFDLFGRDIFSTPDDQVFDTSDYTHIAVFIHDGDITGMKPAGFVDDGFGVFGIIPVA